MHSSFPVDKLFILTYVEFEATSSACCTSRVTGQKGEILRSYYPKDFFNYTLFGEKVLKEKIRHCPICQDSQIHTHTVRHTHRCTGRHTDTYSQTDAKKNTLSERQLIVRCGLYNHQRTFLYFLGNIMTTL